MEPGVARFLGGVRPGVKYALNLKNKAIERAKTPLSGEGEGKIFLVEKNLFFLFA
jgi:hypothetical protein